jgi:O-acetyl-ADP-ribose deacetylase (regulator of RNase III)
MPLLISRNDITKMRVDAIVNAANVQLLAGGGVCGAIFRAAGHLKLQEACNKLAPIKTGEAVITPGFDAPAKYIIHTAGPIYQSGNELQEKLLSDCYYNSLKLAKEHHLSSIAFPLISAGIYGYPPHEVLRIASQVIREFIGSDENNDMDVHLIVLDQAAFKTSQQLFDEVRNYLDDNFVEPVDRRFPSLGAICGITPKFHSKNIVCEDSCTAIDDVFSRLEDNFNTLLLKFIRIKGMTNAEVYKNANVDRKLFSKIISNPDYTPSKNTILALSISLKLNLDDTNTFLKSAGYTLSRSFKSDLIIEYYIKHPKKNYNIDDLNYILFNYKQVQLGQKVS